MELTSKQRTLVRGHAKWLDESHQEEIYNRTIYLAGKYEPKGDADRWLLYLANNIYIYEYCKPASK